MDDARDRTLYEQRMEAASVQRHAKHVKAYQRVRTLRAVGAGIADIARTVGVSRETVYRFMQLVRVAAAKWVERSAQ